jgi:hypothetical protein
MAFRAGSCDHPSRCPGSIHLARRPGAGGCRPERQRSTRQSRRALHPVKERSGDPMTHPPQPTERFPQHSRLSELVTALGFRRYPLFLTGLLHEEAGGRLRRVAAVASRDGDLVAYDAGEVVELAGRVPTSRLFDDGLTGRSAKALVDALADRNQAFFANEVASWTRGRRSVNEVASSCCVAGSRPEGQRRWPSPAPRSSGWSRSRSPTPCWTGFVAWPTATSTASWSSRSWSCSPRADTGRLAMYRSG